MASVPHDVLATGNRLSGKTTVYSPALSVTAPSASMSLAGIAPMPLMAVIWLVMAAVSVAMLAAMLVVDAGTFVARGGRPNPVPTTRRRIALMPSLF
jgi:hypothetical protein